MQQTPPRKKKKTEMSSSTSPLESTLPLESTSPSTLPLPSPTTTPSTSPSTTRINQQEPHAIIYEQDYEYELSMIADMEKRDKEREREREIKIEERDFHIKQVLRKLKLGSSTNPNDKSYIYMLEAWMESTDPYFQTELAESFHSFLEKNIRVNTETREYMETHIM